MAPVDCWKKDQGHGQITSDDSLSGLATCPPSRPSLGPEAMTLFPLLLDRRPVRRFLIPSKPPVRSAAVLPSPTAQYDLLSTYFQRPASAARPFPLTLGHSSSHQRPCPWICSPQWSAYRWKGANGRRRKGRKRRNPWMRSGPPVGTDTSDQLHRPFSVLLRQRPAGTAPRFS